MGLSIAETDFDAHHITDTWSSHFGAAKAWRADLKAKFNIPVAKELKGSKLATGHNSYDGGKRALYGYRAHEAYAHALRTLDFLPPKSIFSVCAKRNYNMYGYRKLEASLYAVFQRLQKQMNAANSLCTIFFDEGHGEYRTLFRKACKHLPTGSSQGQWASGARSKNLPLQATVEDANFKDSKTSHFIQIADLVAYATLTKIKAERGTLSGKQTRLGTALLHDQIPRAVLNQRVFTRVQDGIVRLM